MVLHLTDAQSLWSLCWFLRASSPPRETSLSVREGVEGQLRSKGEMFGINFEESENF